MNKAFFFDRDGILNKLVSDEMGIRPPHNLNELQINYEIYESIQKIKKIIIPLLLAINLMLQEEVLSWKF